MDDLSVIGGIDDDPTEKGFLDSLIELKTSRIHYSENERFKFDKYSLL